MGLIGGKAVFSFKKKKAGVGSSWVKVMAVSGHTGSPVPGFFRESVDEFRRTIQYVTAVDESMKESNGAVRRVRDEGQQ